MQPKSGNSTPTRAGDEHKLPPAAAGPVGLRALQSIIRQRSMLAALEIFHRELGDAFRFSLPGFKATVLVGPEANRFVLVTHRDELHWRMERDPITKLLHHGLLVIDGEQHDTLRRLMTPAFHRRMLAQYVETMWRYTDQVSEEWTENSVIDMLDEIRRMAVLILVGAMFKTDFTPELARLYPAVLRSLSYISPGAWLIWPGVPRPGYDRARRQLDQYLYELIRLRRANGQKSDDLLGLLVAAPKVSDDLIRDQLFTMLIAGHDTSTALLAWVLYLLGQHPAVAAQARAEVDAVLGGAPPAFETIGQLSYLEQVINETLRLYPPLHLGNRLAAVDLEFQGYHLPAGSRVMYSPYLTQRDPAYWPNPTRFEPERFAPGQSQTRPAYTFVPFGGGARICLGVTFAQVEAKVILARLLQKFDFNLLRPKVHMHMGVTIEPRPGVIMQIRRRKSV